MTPIRSNKKLKLPMAFIVFSFAAAMAISFALGRVVGHFGFHHVLLLKALPLTPSFHLFTLLQSDWTKTTSSDSLGSISNIGAGFARHQVENESTYSQSFCPSPEPTGQYLFVDIKNVNKTFLHSDEQPTLATVSSRRTELFQPDRFVCLDKVMQNRPLSLQAYHEALVHPAMMTHANPRRVAIIGDVATLREVLKHKTVETCVMIEIDEMMTNTSKTACCFEDPRVEMYYDNAVAWFVNRFSSKENVLDEDKFDVIIVDALGPSSLTSDGMHKNQKFLKPLYNALTWDGVLVAQVGAALTPAAPAWTHNVKEKVVYDMVKLLKGIGFENTKRYSEMYGGLGMSWSFLVALRRYESQELWYANPAEIDLELSRRTVVGQGDGLLQFFDGATMQTYQYPSRIAENVHCRAVAEANGLGYTDNFCSNGHGLDPFRSNADASSFNITTSLIPNAGRGLISTRHLAKGSYVAADQGGHAIYAMPSTYELVQQMLSLQTTTKLVHWNILNVFLFGYGVGIDFYGTPAYIIETSKLLFINHGCNGTGLMGGDDHNGGHFVLTELTADPDKVPDEIETGGVEAAFYNPFAERNHWLYVGAFDTLQRDMKVGAELLDNYLRYLTTDNWQEGLADYKAQCLQQQAGWITKYEIQSNNTV